MSISLSSRALDALTTDDNRDRVRQMNVMKLCMGALMRAAGLSSATITPDDIAELSSPRYEVRFDVQSDNTVRIEVFDFGRNAR